MNPVCSGVSGTLQSVLHQPQSQTNSFRSQDLFCVFAEQFAMRAVRHDQPLSCTVIQCHHILEVGAVRRQTDHRCNTSCHRPQAGRFHGNPQRINHDQRAAFVQVATWTLPQAGSVRLRIGSLWFAQRHSRLQPRVHLFVALSHSHTFEGDLGQEPSGCRSQRL